MFDIDKGTVGTKICGLPVYHTDELVSFCEKNNVTIGVLTVPKEAAGEVALKLIRGGVRGIWNFANMELKISEPGVIVENIHLGDSLMKLCYELKSDNDRSRKK